MSGGGAPADGIRGGRENLTILGWEANTAGQLSETDSKQGQTRLGAQRKASTRSTGMIGVVVCLGGPFDNPQKQLVYSGVVSQFGMEGGGQQAALSDGHRMPIVD